MVQKLEFGHFCTAHIDQLPFIDSYLLVSSDPADVQYIDAAFD